MKCSECKKEFSIKVSKNRDLCLGRTVIQYTPQGKFKKSFNSILEASKETSINRSGINRCCRGVQKTAGGYVWEYADYTESELYEIISDYIDDCYMAGKTDPTENIKKFLKENKNMRKEQVEKIYYDINDNFVE